MRAAATTAGIAMTIVAPKDGKDRFIAGVDRIRQEGWLDRELAKKGWKVEWVPVPPAVGGPIVNEGFAARTIDIASYGDLPAVIALAGGVDLKLVAATGAGSNIYVVVGAQSPAHTLRELKGRAVRNTPTRTTVRARRREANFVMRLEVERSTDN